MDFITAGYNCRMTDFQAALLISQLNRFASILERKRDIAGRYLSEIKHPDIKLPYVPKGKIPGWQTFHVLLSGELHQADTILKLRELGIGTNYGAQCMPAQTYFANKYGHDSKVKFPNAQVAYSRGLAIPMYEKLTDVQVTYIINSVNNL
jgi:perosamine synthetase